MAKGLTRRQFTGLSVFTASALAAPPVIACREGNHPRLRIRRETDFTNFDPADYHWEDEVITRNVLAPLVRSRQKKGRAKSWEVVPHLATDWTSNGSATEITFRIMDQPWRDIGDLTAEDVKYSFERIAGVNGHSLNAKQQFAWENLEGVDVTGPRTVALRLKSSRPSLVQDVLPWGAGCIVSKEACENMSGNRFQLDPGRSSGRYKITALERGSHLDLDCEENWKGEPVSIQKARFMVVHDDRVADALLASGELDVMRATPDVLFNRIAAFDRLRNIVGSDLQIADTPSSTVSYLAINSGPDRINAPEIRVAIQYAIEPKEVLASVYGGQFGREASSFLPAHVEGAVRERARPFDQTMARELLRDGGYDQRELRLAYLPTSVNDVKAKAIAEQLNAVGLAIRLEPLGFPELMDVLPDLDLALLRVRASTLQPMDAARRFYRGPADSNRLAMGFSSAEYDETFQAAQTELDLSKRLSLIETLQNLVYSDGAYVPIEDEQATWLLKGAVPSFTPGGAIGDLGDWEFSN
ncbi:MAG: ABC transporter substrate-binding protein [Pseudomonadota bacterium]